MIRDVARSLAVAIPGCTAEEAADILWLAGARPGEPQRARAVQGNNDVPGPMPAGDVPPSPPEEPERSESAEPPMMLRQDGGLASGRQLVPATAVGLRAPAAMSRTLSTARVFSVFKRIHRPGPPEIDVDATVEATADARRLTVVTRPRRERGLDVALVGDTSPVMTAYGGALAEFEALLLRAGAFRSVNRWALVPDDGTVLISDRAGVRHHPDRLIDPSGRRLVLLVTDATADHWYASAIWQALQHWAETMPTSIVHVLPEQYRAHGPLGGDAITMRSTRPGGPNRAADVEVAWWESGGAADGAVPLPVVGLHPSALAAWAQAVAAGTGWVDAVWARQPPGRSAREANATLTAEDRVRAFQARASRGAQALARVLAGAPVLSWPLIGVLQARLVPGTGAGELAEVLVSGLLERVTPSVAGNGNAQFRFRPSVSELLSRGTTAAQEWDTFEAISGYLERNAGTGNAIHALLADPQGLLWLDTELEPFAALGHSVAARLGLTSAVRDSAGRAETAGTALGNPFTYGNPISDPRRFFGRAREVEQIFGRLRNAEFESSSVVGERRTGKTSLLNYLEDPGIRAANGLGSERYVFGYIDLQMVGAAIGPRQLWRRILTLLSRQCADQETAELLATAVTQSEQLDTLDLDEIFSMIDEKGLRVVLLLDEFDHLTENANLGSDFYYGLRSLAIHHQFAMVTTSRTELIELSHSDAIRSSPFFNIFANINLRSFSPADFQLMISRSLSGTNVRFTEQELEQISDLSGLHPYFVQVACWILYEAHLAGLEEAARSDLLAERFRSEAIPHIVDYWNGSAVDEQIVLTAAALLERTGPAMREFSLGDLREVFTRGELWAPRLEKRGLLAARNGRYRLFSPVLGPWVLAQVTAELSEEPAYPEWLASNQALVESVAGGRSQSLRGILPRIAPLYRPLILAWASDRQTAVALTNLLEDLLGIAEPAEADSESVSQAGSAEAPSPVTATPAAARFEGRDNLVRPGQALYMQAAGTTVMVEDRIGEDAQGAAYRARIGDAPFAVKWFRDGPGSEQARDSITGLIQRGRPPHPSFVWPIDLVRSQQMPGFGYVMPLVEPRFAALASVLTRAESPSFRVLARLGCEFADAFAALHASGLCFREFSFHNVRADEDACEVAITDVDTIGADGAPSLIAGMGPFTAPEIVRGEARPSAVADLHSLAVLLFYLLMRDHPLSGIRSDAAYTGPNAGISEAASMMRDYGTDPLFVFDPDDDSNGPVPGAPVALWWATYPQQIRTLFTVAFTRGLHDVSLNGRVTESTWRRALLALHDCVFSCPGCGAAVCYDPETPGQRCWNSGEVLPVPPTLEVPGGTLVLSEGAVVTRHHLYRDRDYRSACAVVEQHPGRPGRVVLRNLTDQTWMVVPDGEEPKRVPPSVRLGVRSMQIDFGTVRGVIRCPE